MNGLGDHEWLLKYTRDEGDLVALFYQIALTCAVRYDRLTGYFSAGALTLAARGIEGLVRNRGKMRLVVGCTLGAEEVAAIEKGESLRNTIERRMLANPVVRKNTSPLVEICKVLSNFKEVPPTAEGFLASCAQG